MFVLPDYSISKEAINKNETQIKIYKIINNSGFIINDINRTIKFTILENSIFFIEDFYIKDEMIIKQYIRYITDKKIYMEWIQYVYQL